MNKLFSSVILAIWLSTPIFAQSPCNPHPLFNVLPQHSISGCEEKEYDNIQVDYTDKDGTWIQYERAGYFLKTYYTFDGEWEKRPSNAMIFQNYIHAVTSKGGTVIHRSNSNLFLHFKSEGESWYVHIQSDQSGTFSVSCVREENMNQYIVLSAEDIDREIKATGKALFYGIYFDTDKAYIKPESKATLEEMAKYLNSNLNVKVYIVGHTDNTGTLEHNQKLSEERAKAVINALTTDYKIPSENIEAKGLGPLSPIASNLDEEGKSKNRRVEMVLR
ncbi:OmpA family protein [Mongoliibacter ruber]|uniref:Outer membrane protein OmpA-like peptidoglycan-associated protein n=1 Tax=Mongoliibacter ruber TaxID=1750599 RepID=A0A2T0WE89_9BACT|nr:OmpA family protein [Mongoliibacter ruber]PRY85028.1 outer membrane protein OmpA-like peptidoglycan-associated protein [Mongoliibacter ruber]